MSSYFNIIGGPLGEALSPCKYIMGALLYYLVAEEMGIEMGFTISHNFYLFDARQCLVDT